VLRSTGPLQWTLAVFLSILLWIVAIDNRKFKVNARLPVDITVTSPSLIVLNDPVADSVDVIFEGFGTNVLLDQISGYPVSVAVKLNVDERESDLPVTVSEALSERNVVFRGKPFRELKPSAFSPSIMVATVDRRIGRTIPFSVRTAFGVPGRYYWVESPVENIEIEGAASVVEELDSIPTEPIPHDSGTVTVSLVPPRGVLEIVPGRLSIRLIPPVPVVHRLERHRLTGIE